MTQPSRSLTEFKNDPRTIVYLDRYTDPAKFYAFATYDQSPVHDGPVTSADVLMANLLSLRLTWEDVIPLFATQGEWTKVREALDAALTAARQLPALELCTPGQADMPLLRAANEIAYAAGPFRVGGVRRWTAVTVSKVLHRLSPNVPLFDSRVARFYGTRWAGKVRSRLHADLQANVEWMAPIATRYPVRSGPLPLTRMADILIWMDAEPHGASAEE